MQDEFIKTAKLFNKSIYQQWGDLKVPTFPQKHITITDTNAIETENRTPRIIATSPAEVFFTLTLHTNMIINHFNIATEQLSDEKLSKINALQGVDSNK